MKRIYLIVIPLFFWSSIMAQENHWTPDGATGSGKVLLWGTVSINGVTQTSNDIEVAMFVDGSCRHTTRVRDNYFDGSFAGVLSEGQYEGAGQTVTFKCFDHASGTEFGACPYTCTTTEETMALSGPSVPIDLVFSSPTAYGPPYPWYPVQSQFNATLVALVQIDGEPITDGANWEVGTFCGNTCRGLNGWVPTTGLPYANYSMMTVFGREGDVLSFYLYDKQAGAVHPNVCGYTITWTADGAWGDFWNPVILDFVTPYTFTGTTNTKWSVASNWTGNVVPGDDAPIFINGICELDVDANIASLTVNEGKSITVPNGKALTAQAITTSNVSQLVVADGGQLMGNVGGVLATVQREINGYGSDMSVTNGWNFIASPLEGSLAHASVANLTGNNFDLYAFDQTGGNDQSEWRNFKEESNNLTLNPGSGYLYANSDNVTLNFAGQLNSSVTSVELTNESGHDFSGWNLVGNPFTYNVYINKPHFVMDEGVINPNPVTASSPIAPCTGVMVKTEVQETIAFNPTAPEVNSKGSLHMMLSQTNLRGTVSDHVILSFNEGNELAKYRFGDNATLYFPKDGEDLAIITAENCGEVPVCFKANKNATFRLYFSAEDIAFGYLHLIDNLTGADVDLLASPSYTFNAKTTDYASRFRLVFATGHVTDDNFAFISNGSWVINNEGKATLQVVDIMGRILSSENISGCCVKSLTTASGVYMLRLINGGNVKVQKIIVD